LFLIPGLAAVVRIVANKDAPLHLDFIMASSKSVSARPGNEFHNGPALAAVLAAGTGAFALGLVVLLNEVGVLTVPALYGPAGGVSGRTTGGLVGWPIAWGVLPARWQARDF